MSKKILLLRFDFKREKNLSFGHLFRVNKILDLIKNKFEIYYLIRTPIFHKNYKYLKNKNLKQINKKLFISKKEFKKKIDFLIVDLPYKDKKINLIKSKINKAIVIEDHFSNYNLADYYFSNRNLKKKEIAKINLNKNKIFYGNRYFITNEKKIKSYPAKKIKKIFVNFGGSDPINLTNKLIKVINNINFSNYKFYIVYGPGVKKNIIKSVNNKNINVYYNLSKKKFDNLRRDSDIGIVSGGNILIENIFLGLPSLAFASSRYEKLIINQLSKIYVVKKLSLLNNKELIKKINSYNYILRKKIYRYSKKIKKENLFNKKIKEILN